MLNDIDVPPAVCDDKRPMSSTAQLPQQQSTPSRLLRILPFDPRVFGERSDSPTYRFLPSPLLGRFGRNLFTSPIVIALQQLDTNLEFRSLSTSAIQTPNLLYLAQVPQISKLPVINGGTATA
ncbi:hypothetical protein T265_11391 [Opisthorchis viverrini]|uniref:Uncharacterized protein n=1 Tax=Opisthorchis viverrini TaxID=6198 RepID=A0A074ZXM3_OPIVI|nr:hypothetical protein T265_11391 [Opisthorchis viverrini]KER19959.1 hypothetical protein T265_11391 [Opisthorchis viverrini]